jgi:hypothetical protein
MKKIMGVALSVLFILCAGVAYAIPSLQLDIAGGIYDSATETIIATDKSFSLYAFLIPDKKINATQTYYISAALVPPTSSPATLGSFSFAGTPVNVTSGMTIGTPGTTDKLPSHGIFDTFFKEFSFTFGSNQITPYNTQDRAEGGDPIVFSGTGMFYKEFVVDVNSLAGGNFIHFDLYGYDEKGKIQFAPFSHDAQSNGHKVPEPGTLFLLGFGLVAMAGLAARRKKTK